MTYKELYESAADKLEKSKITLGEFEKMIEPLNAEIDTDSDTISRQAAIDHWRLIIDATNTDSRYNMGFVDGLEFCISHLSTMPSAQPEIIRCKDCKHNPKLSWFGCPMSHLSEAQRPETAWCWKAERREVTT